jgi:hypothetical protein
MPTIQITGDTNMVLNPKLDLYNPDNPPKDLHSQLVIWGKTVYVCNSRR